MDAASAPPVGAAAVGAAAAGAAAALAAGAACDAFMLPLCEEQQRVKELAMAGKNLFLTGCGGCGKSHLIKHLVAAWEREGKEVRARVHCAAAVLGAGWLALGSRCGLLLLAQGAPIPAGHAGEQYGSPSSAEARGGWPPLPPVDATSPPSLLLLLPLLAPGGAGGHDRLRSGAHRRVHAALGA